jgi:hypothetical protein
MILDNRIEKRMVLSSGANFSYPSYHPKSRAFAVLTGSREAGPSKREKNAIPAKMSVKKNDTLITVFRVIGVLSIIFPPY